MTNPERLASCPKQEAYEAANAAVDAYEPTHSQAVVDFRSQLIDAATFLKVRDEYNRLLDVYHRASCALFA